MFFPTIVGAGREGEYVYHLYGSRFGAAERIDKHSAKTRLQALWKQNLRLLEYEAEDEWLLRGWEKLLGGGKLQ